MGPSPALPLPPTGTREAAFVYAISSAGVAFAVTRACSSGELEKCGCDRTVHGVSPQGKCGRWGSASGRPGAWPSLIRGPLCTPCSGFQWSGCSDNIAYGVAFSQSFVDVRERSKGASSSRALMNLHNNEAGRKVTWHFFHHHHHRGGGGPGKVPETLSQPHAIQQALFRLSPALGTSRRPAGYRAAGQRNEWEQVSQDSECPSNRAHVTPDTAPLPMHIDVCLHPFVTHMHTPNR